MSQANLVQTAQSPIVLMLNGDLKTTSLNVAEVFEKRHDNVMRDIEQIIANTPEHFHALNFEAMVYDAEIGSGATRQAKGYNLTFDGFVLLCMGYTGKKAMAFKVAYIEEFNRMRALLGQQHTAPLTLTTTTTRKPLTDLVKTWASQTGQKYSHCYRQVNAHFQLEGIAELPEEWIQDACHFVQSRIDANNQAIAIAQAEQAALPQASLAELGPVHPPQNTCPFTSPTFTPEEMIAGGQLANLLDKYWTNVGAVAKENDFLYQYFCLWGNMGNKKLGLSKEVQMLFENGNHAMQMVKASMFMGQHALKSALNVKSSVAFV